MHIYRTGKTDERNSTCSALFPQLPYHLASNSLACSPFFVCVFSFFRSFVLSLFLFLSLSLSLGLFFSLSLSLSFLWQISFGQCHMFEGLFSDNLSDNLAINICCTRSPGQAIEPFHAISITLERKWKDMNAWMHIGMKMKGTWKEDEGNEYTWKEHERRMKGKWQDITAKSKEYACKWKINEGKMHANECKMKGTWSVAEAPEANKIIPRSISEPV